MGTFGLVVFVIYMIAAIHESTAKVTPKDALKEQADRRKVMMGEMTEAEYKMRDKMGFHDFRG